MLTIEGLRDSLVFCTLKKITAILSEKLNLAEMVNKFHRAVIHQLYTEITQETNFNNRLLKLI